jgi:AcrR family transcriptional regulator
MDRRIKRTKKAIKSAFAELLKVKGINNITVSDIVDIADISRKTFYYHYAGIWDIVEEIEGEVLTKLEQGYKSITLEEILHSPQILFEKISDIFNADIEFFGALFGNNNNYSVSQKFTSSIEQRMKKALVSLYNVEEKKYNMIVHYCIGGMISVYRAWFNSDRTQPIDSFAKDLSTIIFDGINGIVN